MAHTDFLAIYSKHLRRVRATLNACSICQCRLPPRQPQVTSPLVQGCAEQLPAGNPSAQLKALSAEATRFNAAAGPGRLLTSFRVSN